MSQRQNKGLGGGVHSFAWSHHFSGDGRSKKYSSPVPRRHLLDDIFRYMNGSGAVQIHHIEFSVEIGLGKQATNAYPSVDARNIEVPSQGHDLIPEPFATFSRSQVCLNINDASAGRLERVGRSLEPVSG
jgi:hypothetical protein